MLSKKIRELFTKTVIGLGFELVDIEITSHKLIRFYLDRTDGANLTIKDCEVVSNHLTKLLAVEEIDYARLEVSSPGLERPLKRIEDFKKFTGKIVKIKLHVAANALTANKALQGVIMGVDDDKQIIHLRVLASKPVSLNAIRANKKNTTASNKIVNKSSAGSTSQITTTNNGLDDHDLLLINFADINKARLVFDYKLANLPS